MFVEDVLIPIKHLINGETIEQVPVDVVTYYHVELDRHDVLLAEGLPAESYLDTGDRHKFSNGGSPISLFPDFSSLPSDSIAIWEAFGCALLIVTGPKLEGVQMRLDARIAIKAGAAMDRRLGGPCGLTAIATRHLANEGSR